MRTWREWGLYPTRTLSGFDCIMNNTWLMAKKQLNMMEKMMDPNLIDYYIIDCAIPSKIDNRKSLPNRLWQPWVWLPLPLDKIFILFATVFWYIYLVTNQAILATSLKSTFTHNFAELKYVFPESGGQKRPWAGWHSKLLPCWNFPSPTASKSSKVTKLPFLHILVMSLLYQTILYITTESLQSYFVTSVFYQVSRLTRWK